MSRKENGRQIGSAETGCAGEPTRSSLVRQRPERASTRRTEPFRTIACLDPAGFGLSRGSLPVRFPYRNSRCHLGRFLRALLRSNGERLAGLLRRRVASRGREAGSCQPDVRNSLEEDGSAAPDLRFQLVDQAGCFGDQVAFGARRPVTIKTKLSQDDMLNKIRLRPACARRRAGSIPGWSRRSTI